MNTPSPKETTEPPDPLIGRELGGSYRVERLIGKGGMARVYQADQLRLHRKVAIKVLSDTSHSYPEVVARFQREAEIVSLVEHANVVKIYDVGQSDEGSPYLVMEYLEGETLRQRLARDQRLPVLEVVRIIGYLCSALAQVHARRFVHCDIKPSNVFLVGPAGAPDVVKLLDFGVSIAVDAELTGERVRVAGTPTYMAPEQAQGQCDLDHRADQFATAAMTYEMLSGRRAFDIHGHFIEPPPLSEVAPWVPVEIDSVIRRGLSLDRERRHPSISRFAWALEKAASHACLEPDRLIASALSSSSYRQAGLREQEALSTEHSSSLITRDERRLSPRPPPASNAPASGAAWPPSSAPASQAAGLLLQAQKSQSARAREQLLGLTPAPKKQHTRLSERTTRLLARAVSPLQFASGAVRRVVAAWRERVTERSE